MTEKPRTQVLISIELFVPVWLKNQTIEPAIVINSIETTTALLFTHSIILSTLTVPNKSPIQKYMAFFIKSPIARNLS